MKHTNESLMMNSNIEGLLEDLNDAQLEQVSGGQRIFASSSSSSSNGSSSSSVSIFGSNGSATVLLNGETVFEGEIPPEGLSFSSGSSFASIFG